MANLVKATSIWRSLRSFHSTPAVSDLKLKMPSLSPTMSSGTIVKWVKKEGDSVAPGDVLCEIQTDKAVVALEAEEEGILAKILAPDNTADINVGSLIAVLAESGEDWQSVAKSVVVETPSKPTDKPKSADKPTPTATHEKVGENLLGPAVRLLLDLYHIDTAKVAHTGPKASLLKSDVMKFVTENRLKPQPQVEEKPKMAATPKRIISPTPISTSTVTPGQNYSDLPLTNIRKTIAKRLSESKRISAHTYATASVPVNSVMTLREKLKGDKISLSLNDFVIKACAIALKEVPEINVQLGSDGSLIHQSTVDISVAVATENGLITPIVTNADQLGLQSISSRVKELAEKAKLGKLQLAEFQGGTFTVSNLGMFGIKEFTAIINPPQTAILAVGGVESRLTKDFGVDKSLQVTLCYDGQAISDVAAGRFLQKFSEVMADANSFLLGFDAAKGNFDAEKSDLIALLYQ